MINRRKFVNSVALTAVASPISSFALPADQYWDSKVKKAFEANYPKSLKVTDAFGYKGLTITGTRDEYYLHPSDPGKTTVGYKMRYQRTVTDITGKRKKTIDGTMYTLTILYSVARSTTPTWDLIVGANTIAYSGSNRRNQLMLPAVGKTAAFPLSTKNYGLKAAGPHDEERRLTSLTHCGFWTAWLPSIIYTIPSSIYVKPGSIVRYAGLASSYLMTTYFMGRTDPNRPYERMSHIYCWDALRKLWISFVIRTTDAATARLTNSVNGSESRVKNAVGQLYSDLTSLAGIGGIVAAGYHAATVISYIFEADFNDEVQNMPAYMTAALAVVSTGVFSLSVSEKISNIRKNTADCAGQIVSHLKDPAVNKFLVGTVRYLSAQGAEMFGLEASYPDEAPPNYNDLTDQEQELIESVDELRTYGA